MLALLIVIAISGLLVLILTRSSKKGKKPSWIQFFSNGRDAGFNFKEIQLLYRLATASNLEDPTALFWSQSQLDRCIRSMVRNIKFAGDDPGTQEFLSKLYDYRKKIEMEKPRIKNGISSSRQIDESQKLRVLVSGTGIFNSQVIKNTGPYMTISRPVNPNIPVSFSWAGLNLAVYFWRADDAGYVFDTVVIDEVYSKGMSALKIDHSDSLFRTQKRKSVRVKTHKPAFLYLLVEGEDSDKIEAVPGLKCYIEDLSDTGCAVTIGGKAVVGLRVKAQFSLDNTPVVMGGTVRSVEYNAEANRSLLHVEADPLSRDRRNHILGEVFGMLPEEEEGLPFRVLDEEAENNDDQSKTEENTL
jgi:c-di-GMP-binding flagellar brake protein YcgR